MSLAPVWRRKEERGERTPRLLSPLSSFLVPPPSLSIALIALLASATGLVNGFVYDDRPIIQQNARVHTLERWWELFAQPYWPPNWGDTNYRPLTILSFAVQWAIGDGSPAVFHAVSVALYLATCVAVLSLARLLLPTAAAWIVAAFFAAHPVHVEAVANVVGQAELVVALCSTLAVIAYVRARTATETGSVGANTVAVITALYAIACFSKETGFLLPALLVAAELTYVDTRLGPARRGLRARARELWPLYSLSAALGLGYLVARHSVLGGFGDDPNLVISLLGHEARLLTMLGIVAEWARLLGAVLLAVAGWRTRGRVVTLGLLWVAIAIFPVSNLLVRSGVIVAERTLFLPSVGVLLALGAAAAWVIERTSELPAARQRLVAIPVALLLAAGVAKSAARQRVWRDSDAFLGQIVEDAPLSYRAHYMHGMWLLEKGRRAEGERHVRTAIAMFPYDAGPYTDLADQYRRAGMCAPARDLYRRALSLGTLRDRARLGLVACLLRDARFAEAAEQARIGADRRGPKAEEFRRLLAVADSALAAGPVRQAGAARRAGGRGNGPRP